MAPWHLCLSATVPSAESQQECLACVVSACVPFNFSNNFLRHQFCLAVLSHVPVTVPDPSFFIHFQILPIQVILQCCSLISYPPWLTRLQPSDPHLCYQKRETGNGTRNENGTRNGVYRFRIQETRREKNNKNQGFQNFNKQIQSQWTNVFCSIFPYTLFSDLGLGPWLLLVVKSK